MKKLENYNKKRDFKKTKEPVGKIKKEKDFRFVVHHHFARKEHFDLRLEHEGVLVSFAVPKGLPNEYEKKHLAVHVEDHPIDYINFKGKIPEGNYGAGEVFIFDKGKYIPLIDLKKGLKKGHIKFELKGKKLRGVWNMIKTDDPNWLIFKSKEETKKQDFMRKENPFNVCDVKLAKLTNLLPQRDYIFEIKYDGYRILSYIGKEVTLKTRNNKDYTAKFAGISDSLNWLEQSAILDGEVVVFDKKGRSDFGLLTQNLKNKKGNFCYVIFDILALDGKDLRNKPLSQRKNILKKLLKSCNKNILLSSYVEDGNKSFAVAQKLGLEGIVAKKIDSVYNGERDDDWLKIKCYKRQEFVIGGYSQTTKNPELSAIYVGYYKNNKFIFAGKVGTGFNNALRKELDKKFSKITRKSCPFFDIDDKQAIWLSPKYVAEIQFAELTKSNVLRQPSFVGLRSDKNPKNVKLEIENDK